MTNGNCRSNHSNGSGGAMDNTMLCMRRSAMQRESFTTVPTTLSGHPLSAPPLTTKAERDEQHRRFLVNVLEQALALLDDEDDQF
ncbi:expressed unknown protein [Seminavis robusta]|uniref:Uncharacterized protein n=1 Tax=Seminavis robusta TaxID=568900 RepID=A0A9N8H4F1_9STRA|nr:expressed unknown protein [Seminavis robusta]|eukprot:Sro48_g028150.1 n/a (85) ;mRNA; f:42511-42765